MVAGVAAKRRGRHRRRASLASRASGPAPQSTPGDDGGTIAIGRSVRCLDHGPWPERLLTSGRDDSPDDSPAGPAAAVASRRREGARAALGETDRAAAAPGVGARFAHATG